MVENTEITYDAQVGVDDQASEEQNRVYEEALTLTLENLDYGDTTAINLVLGFIRTWQGDGSITQGQTDELMREIVGKSMQSGLEISVSKPKAE